MATKTLFIFYLIEHTSKSQFKPWDYLYLKINNETVPVKMVE